MEINQGYDQAGKSKRKPLEEIEVYHPAVEMISRETVMLDNDPSRNKRGHLKKNSTVTRHDSGCDFACVNQTFDTIRRTAEIG